MLRTPMLLLLCGTACLLTSAQDKPSTPVAVDGAKTPHLIEDREAYFVLFSILSGDDPLVSEVRKSFIEESTLTESEADLVFQAADAFRGVYVDIMRKVGLIKMSAAKPYSSEVLSNFDLLFAQGWSAVNTGRQSVESKLPPGSLAKLQDYLYVSIKARMVAGRGRESKVNH